MHVLNVRNVNCALSEGLWYLSVTGLRENSRNGPVIVAPEPVMTVYSRPQERVLFNERRNANPFFHLMEALWMLAGHNDLAWPERFNSRFKSYSDDGETINGAYGHRWRVRFGVDQIRGVIKLLREDPETRRAVINMWDATEDLGSTSKDIPCNTQIYFDLRGGVLNMTVLCRSNDIIWGAYGANVVHFSVLQEFIAAGVGAPIGLYRQYSHNYHLYPAHYALDDLALRHVDDWYRYSEVMPSALITTDVDTWLHDLEIFLSAPYDEANYTDKFFTDVAVPMYAAWSDRKHGRGSGLEAAQCISAPDWMLACTAWIKRADKKREAMKNE